MRLLSLGLLWVLAFGLVLCGVVMAGPKQDADREIFFEWGACDDVSRTIATFFPPGSDTAHIGGTSNEGTGPLAGSSGAVTDFHSYVDYFLLSVGTAPGSGDAWRWRLYDDSGIVLDPYAGDSSLEITDSTTGLYIATSYLGTATARWNSFEKATSQVLIESGTAAGTTGQCLIYGGRMKKWGEFH